ncbi:hypothetical protein GKZ90_0012400 [Flavobacterium sp. MC2016-06]|jgi:hypothetical protein|uniref:hypothetical protein n=1 Tax=Flavobacterium sp. MC2016-06 TaxID=2676308 RepID=UPI0012BACD94|nr:hypothetical protein [Flavobacterium sp. MC2016-06]MBU3860110.1 hypothetical protein [Flavobacterium sp. MC2016-06]
MALNKASLEAAIKSLLTEEKGKTDSTSSIDNITTKLATAIEAYVKSGTVITTVTTTGSASAQTGTGTGSIS